MGEHTYTFNLDNITTTPAKVGEPAIEPMFTISKEQYDSLHRDAVILEVLTKLLENKSTYLVRDVLESLYGVEEKQEG